MTFGARRGQTSRLRRGAACGGVRWKSQRRKKMDLSFLMSKNLKLKRVIKSFIPEPISCFSDSYMRYEHCERFMHVNIMVVFLDLYITFASRVLMSFSVDETLFPW